MSTGTTSVGDIESLHAPWTIGLGGGLAGGVLMGALFHVGPELLPFIGALYGRPTVLGGWVAHLVHSAVVGLAFGRLVSRPPLESRLEATTDAVAAGVLYSAVVGVVTVGLILAATAGTIGDAAIAAPLRLESELVDAIVVGLPVGIAYLLYGAVLGLTYGHVRSDVPTGDGPTA